MNLVLFLVFVIVLSARRSFHITPRNTCSTSMLVITVGLIFDYLWFKCNILLLRGDVELNPGPTEYCKKNFYLPLEPYSITAHNFVKLALLKVYNSIHKFDLICLLETYLDSNILLDD